MHWKAAAGEERHKEMLYKSANIRWRERKSAIWKDRNIRKDSRAGGGGAEANGEPH